MVLAAATSAASAAYVNVVNFDDGTPGVFDTTSNLTGGAGAQSNPSLVTPGLEGTAGAINLDTSFSTAAANGTYNVLGDIPFSAIADIDPASPLIRYDAAFSGTSGGYNGVRIVANTSGGAANSNYVPATGDLFFGPSPALSLNNVVDLTPILAGLRNAAAAPGGYSTIRFIANNSGPTNGVYTLDNIEYNRADVVPEPAKPRRRRARRRRHARASPPPLIPPLSILHPNTTTPRHAMCRGVVASRRVTRTLFDPRKSVTPIERAIDTWSVGRGSRSTRSRRRHDDGRVVPVAAARSLVRNAVSSPAVMKPPTSRSVPSGARIRIVGILPTPYRWPTAAASGLSTSSRTGTKRALAIAPTPASGPGVALHRPTRRTPTGREVDEHRPARRHRLGPGGVEVRPPRDRARPRRHDVIAHQPDDRQRRDAEEDDQHRPAEAAAIR